MTLRMTRLIIIGTILGAAALIALAVTSPTYGEETGDIRCGALEAQWEFVKGAMPTLTGGKFIFIHDRENYMNYYNALPPRSTLPIPDELAFLFIRGHPKVFIYFIVDGCVKRMETAPTRSMKKLIEMSGEA